MDKGKHDEGTVTGGTLRVVGVSGSPEFILEGKHFKIENSNAAPGRVTAATGGPYRPGDAISFVSNFTGTPGLGIAFVTYHGKDYENIRFVGELHFSGSGVVPKGNYNIVKLSEELGLHGSLTGEFGLQGSLKGYTGNPIMGDPGEQIFDLEMAGKGTVTVELSGGRQDHEHGWLYDFRSITYQFEDDGKDHKS